MIDFFHLQPLCLAALVLLMALLVDMLVGDPRWMVHPVQIIGSLIKGIERLLRRDTDASWLARLKGGVLAFTVVMVVFVVTLVVTRWMISISYQGANLYLSVLMMVLLVFLTSTTIAAKGLLSACLYVIEAVMSKDLPEARLRLSMIVGRDTEGLSADEILKAVIETLSENLSDGIVAPVFFYFIGGLPMAMAYKAINTLDSMVGYRNQKYLYFGWASARLDDIANFIPARITGVFIALAAAFGSLRASLFYESIRVLLRDGRKHLSPNSGMPEAAMAGAVSVRLGGPSYYGGIRIEKPYIGNHSGLGYEKASRDAILIARLAMLFAVVSFGLLLCFLGGF